MTTSNDQPTFTINWRRLALWALIWLGLTLLAWWVYHNLLADGWDLYARWVGARAVLNGENPYSLEVTQRIQIGRFGRLQPAWDDQHAFAYPATITWILLPFWLLPFPLSLSIWLGLHVVIALGVPQLIPDWRPNVLQTLVLALVTVIFFRPMWYGLVLGQYQTLMVGATFLGWWGLMRGKPWVTALCITVLTLRPEAYPLIAVLGIAMMRAGHWRAVWLTVGINAGLYALTALFIGPLWPLDFIHAMGAYTEYAYPRWPPALFGGVPWLPALFVIGTVTWATWMLFRVQGVDDPDRRVLWELGIVTVAGMILLTQTGEWTNVMLLVPLYVILWVSKRRALVWLVVMVLNQVAWLFSFFEAELPFRGDLLVLPALLGAMLTWAWFYAQRDPSTRKLSAWM